MLMLYLFLLQQIMVEKESKLNSLNKQLGVLRRKNLSLYFLEKESIPLFLLILTCSTATYISAASLIALLPRSEICSY